MPLRMQQEAGFGFAPKFSGLPDFVLVNASDLFGPFQGVFGDGSKRSIKTRGMLSNKVVVKHVVIDEILEHGTVQCRIGSGPYIEVKVGSTCQWGSSLDRSQ
jgi:hypothetical protein